MGGCLVCATHAVGPRSVASKARMSPRIRNVFSVRYEHPVELVFPYLSEPEKWLEYVPALIERTRLDDGPVKPGSLWKSADRVGPMTVEFTDELVDLEVNRLVRFRQSAPWNSVTDYKVRDEDGAAIIDVQFEGKPSGKLWWLGLIPDRLSSKIYKDAFADLGKVLDDAQQNLA
jgi:uncharacterized protein YndB with AHSA1/START domain